MSIATGRFIDLMAGSRESYFECFSLLCGRQDHLLRLRRSGFGFIEGKFEVVFIVCGRKL